MRPSSSRQHRSRIRTHIQSVTGATPVDRLLGQDMHPQDAITSTLPSASAEHRCSPFLHNYTSNRTTTRHSSSHCPSAFLPLHILLWISALLILADFRVGLHLSQSGLIVAAKPYNKRVPLERTDFYVAEDRPVNSTLFQISNHNNWDTKGYTYRKARSEPYFFIKTNGDIVLLQKLDFEQRVSHIIYVDVMGQNGTYKEYDLEVTGHLWDVNDNPPQFVLPTSSGDSRADGWGRDDSLSFSLPSDSLPGTRVGQVTATDRDSVEATSQKPIRYYYVRPSDRHSTPFELDSITGVINQTGQLDQLNNRTYIFEIYAYDGKYSSLLTINITTRVFASMSSTIVQTNHWQNHDTSTASDIIDYLSSLEFIQIIATAGLTLLILTIVLVFLMCYLRQRNQPPRRLPADLMLPLRPTMLSNSQNITQQYQIYGHNGMSLKKDGLTITSMS